MTQSVTVRRFTSKDQSAVQKLITGIMESEFHKDCSAYPNEDLADITTSYSGPGEVFFVASSGENQVIVGTAAVKRDDENVALLRRVFVAASHRKQNIAKMLWEKVLEFCGNMGYEEVVFKTTSAMHAAIQFSERSGFTPQTKIKLGELELLKFSFSVPNGTKRLKS